MIAPLCVLLFGAATLTSAIPVVERRAVQALNQAAFAEAQQRDDTATRAFSSTEIKTSDGRCLFVDELSGDFRANLTPIQAAQCDGSAGQKWDVITSGKHISQAGSALIVSASTEACLNFDPRRAAGNQVLLFSCGGRADGEGDSTNSQFFSFAGGSGPLSLEPENAAGTCLTVNGNVLDQAGCNKGDANQSFTFGDADNSGAGNTGNTPAFSNVTATPQSSPIVQTPKPDPAPVTQSSPVVQTPTLDPTPVTQSPSPSSTQDVSVARAGGVLNVEAAAEANSRDDTATRAFSSVSIKSSDGQCLFIDPAAGDFRENLIPVKLKQCDGSAGEKFDIITAGKHISQPKSMLVVSTATNGCLNFDPRRAAGDTVILFSCGGRADGEGQETDSQEFAFTAGKSTQQLAPNNEKGATCLVPAGGALGSAGCSGDASQLFTIG